MARVDSRPKRLYVEADLAGGTVVRADRKQSHYLVDVLRLADNDTVLLFNGRDGEWRARLVAGPARNLGIEVVEQTRKQDAAGNLDYLFAPLKHARLDYMVEKAVEMGASRLRPVLTRYTQTQRVNLDRMRKNAIEAAEQCGILRLPDLVEPQPLVTLLTSWEAERVLIFCDEDADPSDPVAALSGARTGTLAGPKPIAVLVGPEGGFAPDERALLLKLPHAIRLSLGPRILRADTAAVAALALVQATLGDWR